MNKRLKFEWDIDKEEVNIKKHRISFKTATLAFNDPNACVLYDFKHSDYEDRYKLIGLVGKIITVVYTIRKHNTYRIISARKANKYEEELYEENSELFS